MYQVYLLSIVTLILSSVSLGFEQLEERLRVGSFFNANLMTSQGFRFGLGVVTALVGLFQFLSVHPDDTIILGNLVPAAAGMVLGGTLVLGYYREKSTVESAFVDRLDRVFLKNEANFSYLGLLIAILHFFFHRVLFL
ncbi:MAG: hypothetical protein ACOCW3_02785 [Spirochaetota bacterium]